ncbi:uncharacterized protein NECHADRAFT_87205 [Fusarium vanettenii 77-13-4]|uniref:Zn(2)-C6 fungal-type domain-containing protein n=1 Tax=Fusarium vanettenii (strain ATCC MYA-4622 / CBS 123669 / FGSC 9596 / NRRL 45880 / 77-13-4) TaxID=660122 RepID=C7ZIN4_FUSV7|nr:uncharacterized protein NECHADRAFT_87205 [Fusarium vanettenii 77-13-4]EEU36119.1 hypothetical protein NECHADRAFT_87205 [Fusarium vanettenii 77-13-4]
MPKGSPASTSPPPIACMRCRRRKKKCDRHLPKCGECRRSSAECVRFQERKPRDVATVPWCYVQDLESRLVQVEKELAFCKERLARVHRHGSQVVGEDEQPPASNGVVIASPMEDIPPEDALSSPAEHQPHDLGHLKANDLSNYFQYVHPSWPFLDQIQLSQWFHDYTSRGISLEDYQLYFIHLVCAIGACYSSPSDRQCPHVSRSRELYTDALHIYLADAVSEEHKFRTKAYLLLIVYAFHCPTPFQLHDTTNEAILEITERLSTFQIPSTFLPLDFDDIDEATVAEDKDNRVLLIYCYTAFEIIASLWNRSFQVLVGSLDDKILDQGIWLTFGGGSMPADLEHMFAIRRIQSKVRRLWSQFTAFPEQEETRRRQTAEIRAELEQWKAMIPLVSSTVDGSMSYHPLAMLKTYDYSICSLYQHETVVPSIEDYSILLSAASENSRCFRRIQKFFMIYSTWGGLLEQFSIGVILLSCFWGTPLLCRTAAFQAPDALQALEDCQQTLTGFAQKWEAAEIYLEAYTLLLSHTPITACKDTVPSEDFRSRMESIICELENRGVTMAILTLMRRMLSLSEESTDFLL